MFFCVCLKQSDQLSFKITNKHFGKAFELVHLRGIKMVKLKASIRTK